MAKDATKRDYNDEWPRQTVLARPENNIAGTRRCLACDQEFESEGWHNRLCLQCRKRT